MLLLRQLCQPVLDSYGLPELHVIIQNKTLTIVGGCGQPLVSIGGIQFSKNTVSEKERAFALELFEAFMTKHSVKIIDYVAAKRAFVALPAPELPTGYELNTYSALYLKVKHAPLAISIDQISLVGYLADSDIKDLFKTYKREIKEARDYLTTYITHRDAGKLLDTQRTTLSSCDI